MMTFPTDGLSLPLLHTGNLPGSQHLMLIPPQMAGHVQQVVGCREATCASRRYVESQYHWVSGHIQQWQQQLSGPVNPPCLQPGLWQSAPG